MTDFLPSRRAVLRRAVTMSAVTMSAATISLAAAAGFPAGRALGELLPVRRVGGAHLKPAVNAYSFLELLTTHALDASKGIDLFGVCDFCAKLDVEAVDLTGYFFPGYPKPPADAYVARLKRRAHDLGLGVSGTGVRNDFTTADKAARAADVQLVKDWVEVAARLGAPAVRVFADSQKPYKNWQEAGGGSAHEEVERWMADDLRACAEHGEKFGVLIAVQNHGDFVSTGAEHVSLLKRVDHDGCRALVDTGKYMTDDPYADIAAVAPHAVNWQIKETLRSRTDSPRTDFAKLVRIIRAAGYRGYLPVETLSMRRKDYDPFVEVAATVTALREAIAATA